MVDYTDDPTLLREDLPDDHASGSPPEQGGPGDDKAVHRLIENSSIEDLRLALARISDTHEFVYVPEADHALAEALYRRHKENPSGVESLVERVRWRHAELLSLRRHAYVLAGEKKAAAAVAAFDKYLGKMPRGKDPKAAEARNALAHQVSAKVAARRSRYFRVSATCVLLVLLMWGGATGMSWWLLSDARSCYAARRWACTIHRHRVMAGFLARATFGVSAGWVREAQRLAGAARAERDKWIGIFEKARTSSESFVLCRDVCRPGFPVRCQGATRVAHALRRETGCAWGI